MLNFVVASLLCTFAPPAVKPDVKDVERFAKYMKGDMEEKVRLAILFKEYATAVRLGDEEERQAYKTSHIAMSLLRLSRPRVTDREKLSELRDLLRDLGEPAYVAGTVPPFVPLEHRVPFARWAKKDFKKMEKTLNE